MAVGFVGGVLYEVFSLVRLVFRCGRGKRKTLGIVLDVSFGLSFSLWCIVAAHALRFPDVRVYMYAGYALGLIIYLKSLHRILAFLESLCYNKVSKKARRRKNSQKEVEI